MTRESIRVDGMSCAACSSRIENALKRLDGIQSVYANFSSNTVTVEYDEKIVSGERVRSEIENAGYSVREGAKSDRSHALMRDLLVSIIFSVPIIMLSMGSMIGLDIDYKISAIVQLALCIPVVIAGRRFFLRGIPALISMSPTMDTLVALGSGTAFVYSLVVAIMMLADVMGATHLYFASAAMIITLISVGKYIESRSRERTEDAISGLGKLIPEEANVMRDGAEKKVPVGELAIDDMIIVRPGEHVPADSVIVDGKASFDESMITGESVPVPKDVGDRIFAGTSNADGIVTARVAATGEGSLIHGIMGMIDEARNTKAPIARTADRVAAKFVPAVMLIAIASCVLWLIAGKDLAFALTVLISVLVISCPCALGLATPLAITVGTGKAAEYGILFRDAPSLERAGRIDSVIFDKTGTITEGRMRVSMMHADDKEEMLRYAAAAESGSEHPIAKAICDSYTGSIPEAKGFVAEIGSGVRCSVDGKSVCVGNEKIIGDVSAFAGSIPKDGSSVVYVSVDGKVMGFIAVKDVVRGTAHDAVASLSSMGIRSMMVTGDSQTVAESVSSVAGIEDVISSAKPDDKVHAVKKLQANGHDVAMVGDGINDAPALTQSDLGIAMGSGTDIAMDSADVIVLNDDLRSVPAALEIGRATLRNIKENLFFAFCYNAVCIPIAAGVPYLFGIGLVESMPMIAAATMSLSSLSVVGNALRLRRFRPSAIGFLTE